MTQAAQLASFGQLVTANTVANSVSLTASVTATGNISGANITASGAGGQIIGYHTGAIGANVANTGAFTTVTASSTITATGSTSTIATILTNVAEPATISATAATGTINFDITTQSVLYYTTNASANWTVNFRASSGTSLNTMMTTGQAITAVFLVTQGATPYYNNAVTIDGNSVTPKYQGGTAWSSGNASGVDIYNYTIVKTGSAAFTIFATQTQFK
jgi:hypothetical protein